MKITKDFIKSLNPCSDRWRDYLQYYPKWSGSLLRFLRLKEISVEDKLWVFIRDIDIKKWQTGRQTGRHTEKHN